MLLNFTSLKTKQIRTSKNYHLLYPHTFSGTLFLVIAFGELEINDQSNAVK